MKATNAGHGSVSLLGTVCALGVSISGGPVSTLFLFRFCYEYLVAFRFRPVATGCGRFVSTSVTILTVGYAP